MTNIYHLHFRNKLFVLDPILLQNSKTNVPYLTSFSLEFDNYNLKAYESSAGPGKDTKVTSMTSPAWDYQDHFNFEIRKLSITIFFWTIS